MCGPCLPHTRASRIAAGLCKANFLPDPAQRLGAYDAAGDETFRNDQHLLNASLPAADSLRRGLVLCSSDLLGAALIACVPCRWAACPVFAACRLMAKWCPGYRTTDGVPRTYSAQYFRRSGFQLNLAARSRAASPMAGRVQEPLLNNAGRRRRAPPQVR